jgi:hypothetical protein
MESWVKWSIQATRELDPFHAMFQNPKHWVNIRKKRTLVKFGITAEETLSLPPSDRYPDNGITLEISILEIKKTTWWTVGLECFGFPDRVFNNLLKLTPHILGNLPLNGCTVSNSFGYPEWISVLVQSQKNTE